MQKQGRTQILLIKSCLCGAFNATPLSVCRSLLGEVFLSSEDLFFLVAFKYRWKNPHLISSDARRLVAQPLLEASLQLLDSVRPDRTDQKFVIIRCVAT